MASTFSHYLTYQHNVQQYFRNQSDKYQGVIVPLSIATAFPSGTYGFIRALCARHKTKKYAIDPRNALFQKHWNRANVREPHKKMAKSLGGPFVSKGLSGPLTPEDFASKNVLSEVVNNCLSVQRQFRTRKEDERKLKKYKSLLGLSSMAELGEPQFLIPPYFQFDGFDDPWYGVARRCIEKAVEVESSIPIRPVIHFSQWASQGDWKKCHDTLTSNEIEGFWYYPNDFREHDAESAELTNYRDAIELAVERKLRPYSLFGGYYSILLSYFGLAGFSNGIGYGEWRDSGYHRGGTAATRVYLLKLHRFVDAPVAAEIIEKDEEYFGHDTDILAGYVESNTSVVSMTLNESLDHFLECRQLELEYVAGHSLSDAIAELTETAERLEDIGELESEKYGQSLSRWADVLK